MLPQKRRLQRAFFTQVLEKGKSYHFPYFSFRILKSSETTLSRFSVVVSKKISKKAVERNKIKRRMYSIVRNVEPKDPFDCVIWPKSEIKNIKYKEIQEFLFTKLKELNLIS